LAAELKKELGSDSTLSASRGGVFEVRVGNKLVFSKKSLGRFPEDGEVRELIRAL